MSTSKRVLYLFQGILMLFFALIMLVDPEDGYVIIIYILSGTLLVYAINQLAYYFTLARYMVGGAMILCKALIFLDLAVEIGYLTNIPKFYVMIYLVSGMIFAGLVDVLRALETKKSHGIRWELKFIQGVIVFVISVLGLVFIKYPNAVVIIYSISLASSAVAKFTTAFRRSTMVYISRIN